MENDKAYVDLDKYLNLLEKEKELENIKRTDEVERKAIMIKHLQLFVDLVQKGNFFNINWNTINTLKKPKSTIIMDNKIDYQYD